MHITEKNEAYYRDTALSPDIPGDCHGEVAWQSPSNIALVKYWGKHGVQLPNNPSISFTLKQAHTATRIGYRPKDGDEPGFTFAFEGKPQPLFAQKTANYLNQLLPYLPWLPKLHLDISSHNTFPHSSGIASSASSMSALVMGLLDIESALSGNPLSDDEFRTKASFLARLGSGSASRSVFPFASVWGATEAIPGSSQYVACPMEHHMNEVFTTFRDSILIIHAGTKSVSSRAGHQLMENNPFAAARYQNAETNIRLLKDALLHADMDQFIAVTESEALQLHALMMTSQPSFILMQPATLAAITHIRAFRQERGIPLCFTLDAGPNIHLLYPAAHQEAVKAFISEQLLQYCADGQWIDDEVGGGPSKLNS